MIKQGDAFSLFHPNEGEEIHPEYLLGDSRKNEWRHSY